MAIDLCYYPVSSEWDDPVPAASGCGFLGQFPESESDDWFVYPDSEWLSDRPKYDLAEQLSVEQRFQKLADEWSRETSHISSTNDLINDRRYQAIIDLGWPVVPYLLSDLRSRKRFWFPALAAITGVRPFDRSDLSSPRRMVDAWLRWGKWKGLI